MGCRYPVSSVTRDAIVAAAPSCYITSLERLFATIGPQDAEQNITGPAQPINLLPRKAEPSFGELGEEGLHAELSSDLL